MVTTLVLTLAAVMSLTSLTMTLKSKHPTRKYSPAWHYKCCIVDSTATILNGILLYLDQGNLFWCALLLFAFCAIIDYKHALALELKARSSNPPESDDKKKEE